LVVSLGTRHYREAEHRAAVADRVFDDALARARRAVSGGAVDLNAVLRDYLREALDDDARAAAGAARPSQFSLAMLEEGLAETRDALANRDPRNVQAIVAGLAERHGVPPDARDRLAIGVLEAELRIYQKLIRRAKGEPGHPLHPPGTHPGRPLASH
jgi:hypothetical protein